MRSKSDSQHAIAKSREGGMSARRNLPSLLAMSQPLLQAVFMSVHDAAIAEARGI
jgi:hypothetical protein